MEKELNYDKMEVGSLKDFLVRYSFSYASFILLVLQILLNVSEL